MGAQDDNQGTCCPSMGCTPPLPLPKFRQQSGLAASGTPWAAYPTTYLPHKMQKGTRHFLTFYGFRILATFAQIPTWDGQNCKLFNRDGRSPNRGELRSNLSRATEGWGKE